MYKKIPKNGIVGQRIHTSTFLRNQDDSTMDLTELAVAMGSLLFPDQ